MIPSEAPAGRAAQRRRRQQQEQRRRRRQRQQRTVGAALAAVTALAIALVAARGETTASANGTSATTTTAATTTAATATAPTTSTTTPAPLVWSKTTVTMAYGGLTRSYLLVRPVGVTSPLPVVVALHGHSVTTAFEDDRMGFEAVTGPAILVFPAGTDQSWNAGHCCTPAETNGVDDVGFIDAVARQALASVPGADPRRLYLVGYSNGGKMALTLACSDAVGWRGVAVFGAASVRACPSPAPVSLLDSASSGDPEMTIGPGGTPQTAETFVQPTLTEQIASARTAAGCSAPASTATAGTLTTTTWSCAGGRRVQLALYAGGSHAWPAAGATTPGDTATIWAFFTSLGT